MSLSKHQLQLSNDLCDACKLNDIARVRALIESGTSVNSKNETGWTPLHFACVRNHFELAKFLIDQGADMNAVDIIGYTPLHFACKKNHFELAKFLIDQIDQGAKMNAVTNYGDTPLHLACDKNHFKLAKFLIDQGADRNAVNNGGWTPLHWACRHNKFELAKFLIDQGANVHAVTKTGKTPLDLTNDEKIKALFHNTASGDPKTASFLSAAATPTSPPNTPTVTINTHLPSPPIPGSVKTACAYFTAGKCKYGSQCRFLHEAPPSSHSLAGPQTVSSAMEQENCKWPKKEFDDINLQLSVWHLDVAISKAKNSNDFTTLKQLKSNRTELTTQLQTRQLISWVSVEDVYQSLGALLNRLVVSRDELKENDDTLDAAEDCHNALMTLQVRMSEMGLDVFAVGGEEETKTADTGHTQQPDMNISNEPHIMLVAPLKSNEHSGESNDSKPSLTLLDPVDARARVSSGNSCIVNGIYTKPHDVVTGDRVVQPVIVKVCFNDCASIRDGFQKECRYLQYLNREAPGEFVRVFDVMNPRDHYIKSADNTPLGLDWEFLVLEKGIRNMEEDLRLLRDKQQLDIGKKISYGRRLLEILGKLHQHKIVWMDFKLANIVLVVDDNHHITLKGIDFDGSVALDVNLADTSFMGTVCHMPPELFKETTRAQTVSSYAIDIWALGMAIFQLFKGDPDVTFWSCQGILTDEAIKKEITSPDFTQAKVNTAIDTQFGNAGDSLRHFLKAVFAVNPIERPSVALLLNRGLMTGVGSLPCSKLFGAIAKVQSGVDQANAKLDEVLVNLHDGFTSVHQDVEGVGRCLTHQMVKQQQLNQTNSDTITTALDTLITASRTTCASLNSLSNDSQRAVALLKSLQTSVFSFRDQACANDLEMRGRVEALANHLCEVTNALGRCSGSGGTQGSSLVESALQEVTSQMAAMASELTAIRQDVNRILTEVTNLGAEMTRVVTSNERLDAKLTEMSDCTWQMKSEEAKQYADLGDRMSAMQVTMDVMSTNPSAGPMLEMLSAQVEETQNAMNSLLRGTHSIPTLALLLPKTNKTLWDKADPRNLFLDKYRLVFLCSQTYQMAPCGPKGKGYSIEMVKKWVVKAMPVLKLGLILLKLALATGGIPIPGLSEILGTHFTQHVKYVNLALKNLDKTIQSAVENVQEGFVESMQDVLDEAKDRDDLQETLDKITSSSNTEGSRQAYDAIQQLLKDYDIPSTCGLRQVICNGKVGWVLDRDDVEDAYRARCSQVKSTSAAGI